jgi:MYXO-CTERM domain-containing protein
MKAIGIAAVVAAAAGSALAQATFELQIVPIGVGATGSNGAYTTSNSTVSFWLQARVARPAGQNNYGVVRVGPGTTPSSIALAGDASIARGTVNATRRGRANPFRGSGTSGGAFENATGNAPTQVSSSNQGNENGFWTASSLTRWDAYRGFQLDNDDADGNYLNPWGDPRTDGSFTPWVNIYAFSVNTTNLQNNLVNISIFASANVGVAVQTQGSNDVIDLLASPVNVSGAGSVLFTPTPGAAALLGLGALAAGRRRR